ncbi:hypothetical protein OKW40_000317 [Paraburkholderia sp. RAU6.4a]|uniref:hypothetical protein n=1 Tax=Paraburkholderia sp. RAU6.4a TaxID=2991067 RepID=UPI003D19FB7A
MSPRLATQHTRGAHELIRDVGALRDRGELLIEHAGEREQVIALVLQRDAHRADAARIQRFAHAQFLDDASFSATRQRNESSCAGFSRFA